MTTIAIPNEVSQSWQECLKVMENKLGRPTYEICLKGSTPMVQKDGIITIGVPSKFARDLITRKYGELIRNTFQTLSRNKYGLDFALNEPPDWNQGNLRDNRVPDPWGQNGKPRMSQEYSLLPRYTFDTFVVGNSNHLACAAALAVAEKPGKAYNPLFIYGGVGLGKTHLMHAIGNTVMANNNHMRVVYASTEKFTNELIDSIGEAQTVQFRNKYRNVDVLLIDDIQFLVNKERTQEEFFHTFNELHGAARQIVITSDRAPKEIPTLEDRLRSRFEWGLIADIQTPDLETRQAILRKKADLEEVKVPYDVIAFVAEKVPSNIRELEGALTRVIAFASLSRVDIDLEMAQEALRSIIPDEASLPLTINNIQETVSEYFGLQMQDMVSDKRDQRIAYPRQIAMYLAREMMEKSFPDIGKEFGGKDHTTVLHACRKIESLQDDPALKSHLSNLRSKLRQVRHGE